MGVRLGIAEKQFLVPGSWELHGLYLTLVFSRYQEPGTDSLPMLVNIT
jgi:hypothetical protein